MNLPEYFLADLPDPSVLNPTVIREACIAVRTNRRQYLAGRNTDSIIAALAAVAEDWMSEESPYRRLALKLGPSQLGFPPETLALGLESFFSLLTPDNLRALVRQDLGHPHRLDRLLPAEGESMPTRTALARGPELLVQVTGGRLPNPALTSLVLGLLVRSAQFMKCATGTSLLPRLFAHSLREVEPKLGACLEIAEWKGGHRDLEDALFAEADCLTATGSDETIEEIQRRIPARTRFLGYGQRVSFAYVAQDALSSSRLSTLAGECAQDVIAWNQLGCLSPHAIYVETGSRTSPAKFAEAVAVALATAEQSQPRGPLSVQESAAIAARRGFYEVRAAHSHDTQLWCSPGTTDWTVVYENEPRFQLSCLNRFLHVKAVAGIDDALRGVDEYRGRISTVGLVAAGLKEQQLVERLAHWGVPRICPVGRMQSPPLAWRHDGRPSLGDLIIWTDWELPSRW
ncbi:MAG: acyl-CoA reductase [Limisphaerales bacterium]